MMFDGRIDDMKFEIGDRVRVKSQVMATLASWTQELLKGELVITGEKNGEYFIDTDVFTIRCIGWQLELVHRNNGQKLLELLD